MSSTEPRDPRKELDEFSSLCYHIGLALVTWQHVEEAHFYIFLSMLGVPLSDVSSVVYYSTESFEARRKMVNRMAQCFLAPREFKKQRIYWQTLEKDLKDANENRNKLAHYQADYDLINQTELPDGSIKFDVTDHTLRPSRWNAVARLMGRDADSPDHNLTQPTISKYISNFRSLHARLTWFHASIGPDGAGMAETLMQSLKATTPELGSAPHSETPQKSHPSLGIPVPTDEPPSDHNGNGTPIGRASD